MIPGLIDVTPEPTIVQIGPIALGWYGLLYVVGLAVMLLLSARELERRGIDSRHLWNALLFVGALALIGARLYHVIHEWNSCGPGGPCYSQNLLSIVLPPYAGLGLFGGILGAMLGIIVYARWNGLSVRRGLDAVIPGTLFAQGIARWGNFFNQELYGPPTELPWGITIDCAKRFAQYPCSDYPFETTGFHPLFFYESALNIAGGLIALWLSRRYLHRLQAGDLAAFWGLWYGLTRVYLETFREGWNWTLEAGIATAQLVGIGFIVLGVVWLAYNHRPGRPPDKPPPAAPPPGEGAATAAEVEPAAADVQPDADVELAPIRQPPPAHGAEVADESADETRGEVRADQPETADAGAGEVPEDTLDEVAGDAPDERAG